MTGYRESKDKVMDMKISTKGRYALRLMLDLALHSGGSAVSLRDAAARQEISDKYLEQIVTQLSRGGLVKSVRRGRVSAHPEAGGVHREGDPAAAGGRALPGELPGGRMSVQPGRPVRDH